MAVRWDFTKCETFTELYEASALGADYYGGHRGHASQLTKGGVL